MKISGVFVKAALALCCCLQIAFGVQVDCNQFPNGFGEDGTVWVGCPRNLEPVCGTDGTTYGNECGICFHNHKYNDTVEKAYDGECELRSVTIDCSQYRSKVVDGQVLVACPRILTPVCGSDRLTYDNECGICAYNAKHQTNITKLYDGECRPEILDCSQYRVSTLDDGTQLMACTMIYDPVCGTDGVTYASECTLCAHNLENQATVGKRKNGVCEEDITKEHCKGIEQPSPVCTMEYMAHCGSDGKTYGNRCLFCNAYLESNRTLNLMSLTEC